MKKTEPTAEETDLIIVSGEEPHPEAEIAEIAGSEPNATLIGRVIAGKYELLSLLGEGGMSSVFLCRHLLLDQLMALKILKCERGVTQDTLLRFTREAKATYQLAHPNLIRLVDYGLAEDTMPFIVTEFVEGMSLAEFLKQNKDMSVENFVSIFAQVCDGLAYAHSKGIIHRDLKPNNIMVTDAPNGAKIVKIVDFGIAKIAQNEQQLTRTGDVFGSPLYMSPEQCKGAVLDHRSDLYSLGCTMYEAFTGEVPFRGDNPMQTIFMHVEQTPPPINAAARINGGSRPLVIEQIIYRLMSKKPSDRYQSADEVKNALLGSGESSQLKVAVGARQLFKFKKSTGAALLFLLFSMVIFIVSVIDGRERNASIQNDRAIQNQKASLKVPKQLAASEARVVQLCDEAEALQKQKLINLAESKYREALSLAELELPEHSRTTRMVLVKLSAMLFIAHNQQSYVELDQLFGKAEKLLDDYPALEALHQSNIYGWHGIVCCGYRRTEKYIQALRLLRKAENESIAAGKSAVKQRINWIIWQANVQSKLKHERETMKLYSTAKNLAAQEHPTEFLNALKSQAVSLWEFGHHEQARQTLQKAIEFQKLKNLDDFQGLSSKEVSDFFDREDKQALENKSLAK